MLSGKNDEDDKQGKEIRSFIILNHLKRIVYKVPLFYDSFSHGIL